MGGETEWEGILEVCLGQRWGTVNSDGWTPDDSWVICRDLGYIFKKSNGMCACFVVNLLIYLISEI